MRTLYDSLKTKRYHTRNVAPQTTADHTAGMLILLDMLHPNPSLQLYRAILFHDVHEKEFGDVPSTAKTKKFRELEDKFADKFARKWFVPQFDLTEDEWLWLHYLDKLEVLYYISQSAPSLNQDEIDIYNFTMPLVMELEDKLREFGFMELPTSDTRH